MSAFASYVPDADTDVDDAEYDDYSKPQSQPIVNGQFYKVLSKILMNYLDRLPARDYVDDISSRPLMGYYGTSKRNMDGFTGVDKRKIFWQPLGYNPSRSGHGGSGEAGGSGKGRVFRYG